MASHSSAILLENKAKVVSTLTKSAQKQGNDQFTSILDVFKVTPESEEYIDQVKKPNVQFGFVLDSATSSLDNAQPTLEGQTESLMTHVLNVANKLPQRSELNDERAIAATADIIERTRHLKSLHRSKGVFGNLIHIIKSAYSVVLSILGSAVDTALYLLSSVIQLVWFVLTLPLRVWPLASVFSSLSGSS
jgi:hypothetical protein